jgi:hypothetical protein
MSFTDQAPSEDPSPIIITAKAPPQQLRLYENKVRQETSQTRRKEQTTKTQPQPNSTCTAIVAKQEASKRETTLPLPSTGTASQIKLKK